jgi:small conductance mechanosensitive channel
MDGIQTPSNLDAAAAMAWAWTVQFVPRVGAALLIAVGGYMAARWTARAVAHIVQTTLAVDPTLVPAIAAVIRYAILIFVFVATLGQLGIQTASVLAALGAAGLAIGLALQGTLSNIAAGIMLLWLRPFRVGDYIETPVVSGTVTEIGLFVSEFRTFDGVFRFVPNQLIWNQSLVNYTRNDHRLAILSVGVSLDADTGKVESLIRDAIGELQDGVAKNPSPEVFLDSLADNFAYISVRAWLPSPTYWSSHRQLLTAIREKLLAADIAVQRLMHSNVDVGDPRGRYIRPHRRGFLRFGRQHQIGSEPAE